MKDVAEQAGSIRGPAPNGEGSDYHVREPFAPLLVLCDEPNPSTRPSDENDTWNLFWTSHSLIKRPSGSPLPSLAAPPTSKAAEFSLGCYPGIGALSHGLEDAKELAMNVPYRGQQII